MSVPDGTPPPGMDTFEAIVTSHNAPAVIIIDRELVTKMLAYIRFLERKTKEETGSFY